MSASVEGATAFEVPQKYLSDGNKITHNSSNYDPTYMYMYTYILYTLYM